MNERRSVKQGVPYFEYFLLYVDDVLVLVENVMAQIKQIDKYFLMKQESIGPPKIYLGAKLKEI